MSEKIIVMYKRVGKEFEYLRVDNIKEEYEKLVGGEFDVVDMKNYVLIYNKNSNGLIANVIVDASGYGLGLTLRGNVIAVAVDNEGKFVTHNKDSATQARILFKYKSIDYSKYNSQGKQIKRNRKKKYLKNNPNIYLDQDEEKIKFNREYLKNNLSSIDTLYNDFNIKSVLKMILQIQLDILKFINNVLDE